VLLFTLSSLVCSFIPSGSWFIFFRFVQGIGASFTSATGAAIMVSSFAPQYRGRVLGISVSAVYLGLAVGTFVGGILTQYAG
jgi:MFS family permease